VATPLGMANERRQCEVHSAKGTFSGVDVGFGQADNLVTAWTVVVSCSISVSARPVAVSPVAVYRTVAVAAAPTVVLSSLSDVWCSRTPSPVCMHHVQVAHRNRREERRIRRCCDFHLGGGRCAHVYVSLSLSLFGRQLKLILEFACQCLPVVIPNRP